MDFIDIEKKINHPIAVAQMEQYGHKYFLKAEEVNAIVDAIKNRIPKTIGTYVNNTTFKNADGDAVSLEEEHFYIDNDWYYFDGVELKKFGQGSSGASAYQIWLENGHTGSELDYLAWKKGDNGDPLTWDDLTEEQKEELRGSPGLTPYIGSNGNWWIGDEDTEVRAINNYTLLYDSEITGIRNDLNNEFRSKIKYIPGTLKVYLDGVLLTKGNNEDFVELDPGQSDNGALINRIVTHKNKLAFEFIAA